MEKFSAHFPPSSVLLVVTRRIGDVLLATPLLRSIKAAWPQARVDVLVFTGTEGIIAANADINHIFNINERPTLREHFALLKKIWRRYDVAVSVIPGDRPTLYAWAAGKFRVGTLIDSAQQHWKQMLLQRWVAFDDLNTHTVLMNLQLADLLKINRCYSVGVAWSARLCLWLVDYGSLSS